jgi:hypothetical protein
VALPPFRKINVAGDTTFSRAQDDAAQVHRALINIPILNGALLEDVVVTTGAVQSIPHQLGRTLIGWMVVRQRASAIVWDTQDANTNPQGTLFLNSSATVTVDLWVF